MWMTYCPKLSTSLTMLSGGRGGITPQIYRRSVVDCCCITRTVFGFHQRCIVGFGVESKRRFALRITIGLLILGLAACSTAVVPMDGGTYMLARRSAQAGFGPPLGAQAKVYQDASAFCAKQGRVAETVKLDTVDSGFARPGSVNLQFRCVLSSPP